jgi:hypothetical protein
MHAFFSDEVMTEYGKMKEWNIGKFYSLQIM